MPKLFVTDREGAEERLRSHPPVALVSCHNPGANPCEGFEGFSGPKISFNFADSAPGDRFEGEAAATVEQVKTLLEWGQTHKNLNGEVLVHCNAGVGRSPAVAFALQALWDDFSASENKSLALALVGCTTGPMPNEHIVSLADNLLGREGRMLFSVKVFNDSISGTLMY